MQHVARGVARLRHATFCPHSSMSFDDGITVYHLFAAAIAARHRGSNAFAALLRCLPLGARTAALAAADRPLHVSVFASPGLGGCGLETY